MHSDHVQDERLRDLLEASREASRRRARHVGRASTVLRRGAGRGLAWGATAAGLGAALVLVGGPAGALLGSLSLGIGLAILASSLYALRFARRPVEPDREDLERHALHARMVGQRFATTRMPQPIVDDWEDVQRLRGALLDLASDGWITSEAIDEVERRVRALGSLLDLGHWDDPRDAAELHQRVMVLLELMVALGDVVMARQDRAHVRGWRPATLQDAENRMAMVERRHHRAAAA